MSAVTQPLRDEPRVLFPMVDSRRVAPEAGKGIVFTWECLIHGT
jgi:hypothetical protein